MAHKVEIHLVDDIDGGEADETVTFGLDGNTYEIDLNSGNAANLREVLSGFIDVSRKKASKTVKRKVKIPQPPSQNNRPAKIRAWAREAGIEISERGRVSQAVVDKYEAAQKSGIYDSDS